MSRTPIPGTTIELDPPWTEADIRTLADQQAIYTQQQIAAMVERVWEQRVLRQLAKVATEPREDALGARYDALLERVEQLIALVAAPAPPGATKDRSREGAELGHHGPASREALEVPRAETALPTAGTPPGSPAHRTIEP